MRTLRWTLSNATLILLSLLFVPIGATILCYSFAARAFSHEKAARQRLRKQSDFRPRKILITGFGTTTGLVLARNLYRAGHAVVGADWESDIPLASRFSRAIESFYALPSVTKDNGAAYYAQELIRIIGRESVDMWISCRDDALGDARARKVVECSNRKCVAFHFSSDSATLLSDQTSFLTHLRSIDLPAPEIHPVSSRAAVHGVLNGSRRHKKTYTLRKSLESHAGPLNGAVLPRRTVSQTYQHVSEISVSQENPFLLEEVVTGDQYRTLAMVVRNEVKAFTACPVQDGMTICALADESTLGQSMQRYTQTLVSKTGQNLSGFLGLTFSVTNRATEKGTERLLYASHCRLHPDATGIPLFCGPVQLSQRLLDIFTPVQVNGISSDERIEPDVFHAPSQVQYYWTANDLVTKVLKPLAAFARLEISVASLLRGWLEFLERLAFWHDPMFEWWDPVPWWWTCQVYWPLRLIKALSKEPNLRSIDLDLLEMR